MPKKRKQIRFEEGDDDDWSGSSSSSSRSSVASFHRDSYPKKGRTRIPARLVSKRALVDLGYPFVEEGAAVVLLVALDERLIDEVLKLSEEYRRSDQEFFGGRDGRDSENQSRDRGFDWVNIETPETVDPLPNSGYDEASESDSDLLSNDTDTDEIEGPVAYSGVLGLNTTKVFGENDGDFTAGKFPAWNQERSELINGTTNLFLVHAAEFYMDRAGKHRITLVCPNRPENHYSDPSLVRMRWLHVQAQPLNIATLEDGGSKSLETLQVPQLWSLTIGAELIITCSEMSSEEIGRDLITIEGKESRAGVYTIRLIDERDTCRYHIVIKKDCKYVDFLRHAVSLVRKGRSSSMAYVLVSDSGVPITPDKWLYLLTEGFIEDHVFCLRSKDAARQIPDDDIRALSARLTAGSRSSLGTYSRRR
ncbi:hypothetical protein CH35J_001799 [Colletotrichum higginsianum]|uniref:DUF8035 domain-containing protein n=1 Tax=Colletotrichum higginsianum TaxID=80884 RepID=A0A4T0WFR1_9PEZI|nr:hypothetical protein CH35J_001799 [Colletotrichum higginsianum]